MHSYKPNPLLWSSLFLLALVELGWGAAVGEKREMPASQAYGGGYPAYDQGSYAMQPQQQQTPGYAAPQSVPNYGPGTYTNPGFSVQTGFEGFLVIIVLGLLLGFMDLFVFCKGIK